MNVPTILIRIIVAVFVLFTVPVASVVAEGHPARNVLLLNSYHPGFSWSDEEETGVIRQLKDELPSASILIEYLDAKRYPQKSNLVRMKTFLIDKYQGKKIDLIIALDDAAVEILTTYCAELFQDIPVVVAGVTSFHKYAARGRKDITAVLETQDIRDTIDTALKLHPDTREILAISDRTVSGISAQRALKAIMPLYNGRVKIRFLPECTFEEARAAVAALPTNSIILLNSYATDSAGKTLSTKDSTHMIVSSAKVPVYGVHENRLGDGIVGGYLLSGLEQGRRAASIGLRILAGEDPGSILIDEAGTAIPMFDYNQMDRFHIPVSMLPKGSIIINKPASVFTTHRKFAISITTILIILVVAVSLLAFFVIRLLQARADLRRKTEELDRIFNLSLDLICIASFDGRLIRLNQAWESTLGYSLKELEGRMFIDLIHADDIEASQKTLSDLRAGRNIVDFINRNLCKDGTYRWIEWRSKPYQDALIYAVGRDVTEREKVEEQIQRLSETWNLAQKMAKIGHWSRDVETREPIWSDQMFLILGFDPERGAPNYETFIETLHPDDREMFEEAFQSALNGTSYNIEARAILPDGSMCWFNAQGFPRYDQHGNIVEIFGTLQDITERKQTEEALRFTQYAIDKTIDQAFWMTEDGSIFYVNDAACRALGYAREELLTLSAPDVASPPKAFDEHWRDLRKHGSITFETLCRAKDGHRFPVEIRANYVVFDGKEYNCAFVTDITERKRMEQSLRESEGFQRALLQTIPDLIWLKHPNGVFLACNAMFERLYGAKEEEIVGKTDYDFVEKNLADFFRERDRMAIAAGEPTSNEEWVTFADNGHRALLETIKTPMIDDRGKLIGVLGVARDITERKKAEEEKVKLKSQLQQAQKMESVGRLAGGVAHDFNNMLGVILGYGELVLEETDPSLQLHGALQEIMKAAQRSTDITRQLLAFARKQTISPKVLDLNKTVLGMTDILRRFIGEDIDLVWLPAEAIWPVRIDPGQIDQILVNLCVNARDAIPDVGKVTIETCNVEFDETYCTHHFGFSPGEYVLLAVSDNGNGMDAETLENIFEPFFTTKASSKGTGLGLATVYGIVKQNKGFINVYSEPGQGTTFKIYLPRHRTNAEYLPEKVMEQPAETGHETILLVEDELAILKMTTMMLENLGYQVMASRTPTEATGLAREYAGDIHLLVTDVVMPEMNGRDLVKSIRSIHPHIKCLFMSGYTANVISHHGVLDNGVNFIQKPFSKKKLGAKVREALGKDETQGPDLFPYS